MARLKYAKFRAEKDNPYISRLRDASPQLYEDMGEYGRRNIACFTYSYGDYKLLTRTTSGIEPVFMPVSAAAKSIRRM